VVAASLKEVVDEIEDPVIVLDGDDGIAYVNAAAGAVLGVAEADLGRPVDAVVEGLTDTVRAGELYRHADDAVATDGGSELVFDPAESPVRDHRGVERGRAIVLRDVTEQKRREELLEQFARSLSHDLRNPLTVAHGNVELARETGEGDLSALDDVEASLERMEEMVDGLLAASRPADDPDLVPVRLSTVARDAWETVHTGDATLTHAGTDRSLFASRRHLRQILENLFRNAVEHNDEPVTVTVERTETGFVVADDGIGIPVEEQDAVFDRGYTTADSGTGLGLDIVAHLCRRHGWTVSAAESDAGGTAFVVETGG
jgi:PAS domain S-box-containing protein